MPAILVVLALSLYGQEYNEVSTTYGITGGYGTGSIEGGGGISAVDFDGDGLDDLTFGTTSGVNMQFYKNMGGTMQLLNPPPVTNSDEVKGILWVDFDNDGDRDLFFAAYGAPNRLFENTGNLNMVEVTAAAGLPIENSYSFSASASDYDRDGDLDLYVGNYGPVPGTPDTNYMYRNNGDGTFTDVTGITGTADSTRQTLCASFFDYNNDGWEDLYVSNDRPIYRNALYHNNGDGTFSEVSAVSGTDITIYAMNVGVGDYDQNGYLDIYVTNIGPSATLRNNGDGTFTDVADSNGTIFDRIGWGGNFFDFDNDLDLDLYVSSSQPSFSYPNAFYVNDGTGHFSEPYANTGGLQGIDYAMSFCNTIADFNSDGRYDIAVCNGNAWDFHVWEGMDSNANHWFKLELVGTSSNRDAIGSWIEMWVDGQKYIRSTHSHQAYLGQNSNSLIMGTGPHYAIDSLVILWPYPSGGQPYTKEVIQGAGIQMGAVNTLVEGQGCDCEHPQVLLVTNPGNAGPATLRDQVAAACPCDTIRFAPGLDGDTITLSGTPLTFEKSLTIESVNMNVVIRLADSTSAWSIPYGIQIAVQGLDILDGMPWPADPLITNDGVLTLDNVTLTSQSGMTTGQQFISSSGVLRQRGVVEVRKD